MPRRLAALAALCAAGAVPARGAAAEPPAHVGSSGGGAAAPEAGRRWSVPFSLRDAGGRDLVAEAAALRRSGGGRRLMAELGPAPPLELNFTAQGVRFSLELHRAGPVFTPRARIVNGRGEAVPQHRVTAQPIFRSEKHGAVLSPVDGGLRGLVRMGGSLLDVEADPSTGTLAIAGEALAMERAAGFTADEGEWMPDLHGSARIFDPGAVERWTNCYTDDHITRALSMGVSIGSTLMARFTGAEDATEWLQSVFAMANMIYTPQLNFVLMIDQVYIPTLVGEHPGWTDCSGIAGQLDSLASWDQPSRQGLWHLFDDCWVSGTIGLANRGDTSSNGMCQIDKVGASHTNVGVTWVSADTWLTFAHEGSADFGADHAFENGQGTTGGIMDYGDGKHEGIYQFNTASTKDDICPVVAYRVDQGCEAISNFFAECGNEVVEEGEECECAGGATSCSFCSGCVLHAGKECTPDAPDGQCCNCDGSFKSSYHTSAPPGNIWTHRFKSGVSSTYWRHIRG
ncbi:unnamed protein product [Prorocentrum cordatum]|uniref:Phospholipase B-like n=1 Tax=Prorocentrum cordatum TaxID=2364126 RepID=A0ABN9WQN1_9DINO|nr:unnamed protein product [Polarella glacialis]